ncbi:uncharacterized protein FIBRA_00367 [Fibroporia radiculosa]|uniref:Cytochrome c oxidase subunit 8, mitochondrial n=1 Tax=Fibroporia radiculosa TaxID=599839 RepID=J7RH05_9APHY|nr:uncharacterized protein FIBRA_00367 [Fibroporia radiculosa]CCL98372.1 predicted protein [Fibroporia radiculosa]
MSAARMSSSSLRLTTLARAPRRSLGQVRLAHAEHGTHQHLPFTYKNKKAFAAKYFAFVCVPFSIPFIAAGYQLRKAGSVA